MKRKARTVTYIILFVAATGVALYQVRKLALNQVRAEFNATTQVVAEELNDKIESYIAERMIALRQVGIFYENSEVVTPGEFKNFAEKTVANVLGVQVIEYLDHDYVVRAVYPFEENRADFGRDLKASSDRLLLDKSREGGMIVLTDPVELAQGGVGIHVSVPIFKAAEFAGFIRGTLRVDDLLAYFITGNIEQQFILIIKDGAGKPIYGPKGLSEGIETSKVTRTTTVGDQRWQIEIWPKAESFNQRTRFYDVIILAFGVLFAASISSLIWFLGRQSEALEQEVEKRTRKLEEKTRDLDQAQQRLAKSEERYRQLVHGLDAIVWEADPLTLQFTFVNKQVEMILGYSADDWLTTPSSWIECLHPEDRAQVVEHYKTAATKERDQEFECRMIAGDGRTVWLHNSIKVARDDHELAGLRGFMVNITDRKQAEQELWRERELMKAMLAYTPDHVYFKDADSRFLRISRAQAKRFGLDDPSQAIGKTDFDFFGPEHAGEARADELKIMESGEPVIGLEEHEVWLDGSETWVSTTKVPLRNEAGQIIGTFGVSRDITEQKRAQEELRRNAEELERSNNELQQFAYVASHDLQEPLRMVGSYTQLLARRYKGKLGQEADEFIAYAVDGANRMQTLINDLLAYSRVGTQGRPFGPTLCDAVVSQAVNNLRFAVEDSEAAITRDPLPTVLADQGQLVQVFQNLIGNALKFRKRGVRPLIHVGANRVNGEWVLSVKDNGIGIEPQYFDRIFVIFQRLHGKGAYPGTGIGLAICKKIVERHGGRIWVESEPDNGTKFLFTIPEANNDD
jgi:PAS domain S-box-containing protein